MQFIPQALKHRPLFWDSLIVLAVCILLGAFILLPPPWKIIAVILLALLLYSCFVEPWIIVTKNLTVTLAVKRPLRIAFVSDFHVGPHKGRGFMRRIAAKVNALKPDLILLGGDFLYNYQSDPHLLEPLADLRAPMGIFGVMGNHDSGRDLLHGRLKETEDRTQDIEDVLMRGGIVTLHNEWKDLGEVILSGTDDVWMKSYDLASALKDIPEGKPVILLTHNPDAILDERAHRADLILSGHTHGGQVRLPWIGAISPIPSLLGRKYDRGSFELPKKTKLIVSHGVGESMARPRFCAAPEVLLINIQP